MKCHYKNGALVTDKLAGEWCCSVMEELRDLCHMRWAPAVGGKHELSLDDQVVLLHNLGHNLGTGQCNSKSLPQYTP